MGSKKFWINNEEGKTVHTTTAENKLDGMKKLEQYIKNHKDTPGLSRHWEYVPDEKDMHSTD